MKITEQDKSLFREIQSRHNLKEGILSMIFKKKLKSALMKDKDLQKALKDGDKYLDKTKKWIKDQEKQGNKIPDYLKKMVG
jgi:hypothetical protein